MITPASAVLLFSAFMLDKPNMMPNILMIPPQAGMIARHKLIKPSEAEARDRNFAVRNSGSRLLGSTSILKIIPALLVV